MNKYNKYKQTNKQTTNNKQQTTSIKQQTTNRKNYRPGGQLSDEAGQKANTIKSLSSKESANFRNLCGTLLKLVFLVNYRY
jgi:hypothetical protein